MLAHTVEIIHNLNRSILFPEKWFLRILCCSEQTHSCEQNLQETRHWRKEGKWSDMGNYRTRVHLTDNATGWDQWQRGDWLVWSNTIASFSLSDPGLSRFIRRRTARRRLSVVILMRCVREAWVALNHKHHMLTHHVRSGTALALIIAGLQSALSILPFPLQQPRRLCAHPTFIWSDYKNVNKDLGQHSDPHIEESARVFVHVCVFGDHYGEHSKYDLTEMVYAIPNAITLCFKL